MHCQICGQNFWDGILVGLALKGLNMFDSLQLKDFCENFYGYGDISASRWFISMEEGGGDTKNEIAKRVSTWLSRGRQELEDAQEYCREIGLGHWFDSHPKIQKTWAASIRILLAIKDRPIDTESVREFQRTRLGRLDCGHRLTPLFPLPSKSVDQWNYGKWTDSPDFKSRKKYQSKFETVRTSRISAAIASHKPASIVFYGTSYSHYWKSISKAVFKSDPGGYNIAQTGETSYIICKHPAVQGISNEYFKSIGHRLASAQS